MISRNTYRVLIWIIVVLAATTFTMGFSFWYHKKQEKQPKQTMNETQLEMPAQQRTRFFKEQLDLQPEQIEIFRELNRSYNRTAQQLTVQLQELRVKMIEELGTAHPDSLKLDTISEEIGRLHAELKKETIEYYMAMKSQCNNEQQVKLNELFMSALKTKEDVSLPQQGRRYRGNFN